MLRSLLRRPPCACAQALSRYHHFPVLMREAYFLSVLNADYFQGWSYEEAYSIKHGSFATANITADHH